MWHSVSDSQLMISCIISSESWHYKQSKTKWKKKHQRCMTTWPVYRPELVSMLKWGNGKARIQGNWVVRQSIIVEKNTPGLVLFQFPIDFERFYSLLGNLEFLTAFSVFSVHFNSCGGIISESANLITISKTQQNYIQEHNEFVFLLYNIFSESLELCFFIELELIEIFCSLPYSVKWPCNVWLLFLICKAAKHCRVITQNYLKNNISST